ncbi:hypothetical protein BKA67DRAFT_526919, partial [Truncatella angustata]
PSFSHRQEDARRTIERTETWHPSIQPCNNFSPEDHKHKEHAALISRVVTGQGFTER